MKRNFAAYVCGHPSSYGSQIINKGVHPLQPDFPSLDIGYKCEFPMPESTDIGGLVNKPKNSTLQETFLSSMIRDQYLEDQLHSIFQSSTKVIKASSITDRLGSKCPPVSAHCKIVSISADCVAEACNSWETANVRDLETEQRFSSCCASLCSTIASAASTVTSASLSPWHTSAPPALGDVPLFALWTDVQGASRQVHAESRLRRSSTCMESIPVVPAAFASDPPQTHSPEAAAADAAAAASLWMILKALESRAAASAGASPPAIVAADGEEYSLGSGWTGA